MLQFLSSAPELQNITSEALTGLERVPVPGRVIVGIVSAIAKTYRSAFPAKLGLDMYIVVVSMLSVWLYWLVSRRVLNESME